MSAFAFASYFKNVSYGNILMGSYLAFAFDGKDQRKTQTLRMNKALSVICWLSVIIYFIITELYLMTQRHNLSHHCVIRTHDILMSSSVFHRDIKEEETFSQYREQKMISNPPRKEQWRYKTNKNAFQ